MDELWIRLIERWRSLGVPIRAGASSSAIVAFEQRYHVLLPDDVGDYFLTADGTDEMDDDFLFRFWPLAEVKPVRDTWVGTRPNQYPDRFLYPDCFVFADHCISCWDYAVKLTIEPKQPAPVFRVTGNETPGEQMADSFREFMSMYALDPKNIL